MRLGQSIEWRRGTGVMEACKSTGTRTWHVVDAVELGEVAPLLLRVRVIRVNALKFTPTLEESPATPAAARTTAFAVLGRHAVELAVLAYGHLEKGWRYEERKRRMCCAVCCVARGLGTGQYALDAGAG